MPEFGKLHDDGLLFVSAKSLAEGDGFRILSLEGEPAQTKYPILYPLFLSAVWKLNPHFPENLWTARVFSWILLVLCLGLAWTYLRQEGFSDGKAMLLTVLLGLNPYMILFGTNLFSEIFFMCWLLAALLLARREGVRWAILAGVAAGCAYLSRTAGVALLVSMPAWYLYRREFRRAAAFAAGMLPFVLGWMFWSRGHILHTTDQTMIYYTDYIKYELLTVGFDNLHMVLWKNIDSMLYGMGSLAIPQVIGILPVKILTQVVAIAMISGIVRLVRRGVAVPYALFALISSAIFSVWHFPPNERFVLPTCPLLLAGLLTELEHIAGMLCAAFRKKDLGERIVAGGMAACVASIFVGAIALQCLMSFSYLYDASKQARASMTDMRAAYRWIETNVPSSAKILSNDDPVLYLYSGRQGHVVPLVPRFWYADDHEQTIDAYRNVASYCRSHGFEYFYSNENDVSRWTDNPNEVQAVRHAVRENPELTPLFQYGFGTVYKVRP